MEETTKRNYKDRKYYTVGEKYTRKQLKETTNMGEVKSTETTIELETTKRNYKPPPDVRFYEMTPRKQLKETTK